MRRYIYNNYLQYLIQHLVNLLNSLLMRCPRVTYEYLLRFISTRQHRKTTLFQTRSYGYSFSVC